MGCFYAVGTLLNRMIIKYYPVSPATSTAQITFALFWQKFKVSGAFIFPSFVMCLDYIVWNRTQSRFVLSETVLACNLTSVIVIDP